MYPYIRVPIPLYGSGAQYIYEKQPNKLRTYAKQRDRVYAFSLSVGKFNATFQIIYKHPEGLKKEINKIKEIFAENLIEYELVNIEKELEPKMLPDEF